MQDEAAFDRVSFQGRRSRFAWEIATLGRAFAGVLSGLAARELIPPAGEFFDGAAFFEFCEHLEKVATGVPAEVKSVGNLVGGGRSAFKLKKTQYVIRTRLRGACHGQQGLVQGRGDVYLVPLILPTFF